MKSYYVFSPPVGLVLNDNLCLSIYWIDWTSNTVALISQISASDSCA